MSTTSDAHDQRTCLQKGQQEGDCARVVVQEDLDGNQQRKDHNALVLVPYNHKTEVIVVKFAERGPAATSASSRENYALVKGLIDYKRESTLLAASHQEGAQLIWRLHPFPPCLLWFEPSGPFFVKLVACDVYKSAE
jgi:hypothetical protein